MLRRRACGMPLAAATLLALTGCTGGELGPDPTRAPTLSAAPSPSAEPASWPSALAEEAALRGDHSPLAVVWLALESGAPSGDDMDVVQESVRALGYETLPTPVGCQQAAAEPLGVAPGDETSTSGLPLHFISRADAHRFAELYDGDVLAVVEGDVFCHFT